MFQKVFILFCLLFSLLARSQKKYPTLQTIVTDGAHIFTPNQQEELQRKLTGYESETTHQIVILTIPELGTETIETYANGTFNSNQLGQKNKDNGLLILFSKLDREVRIEVGYGLEPYITDAVASRIVRNIMIPNFKKELYYDGITKAVDQIITLLSEPDTLTEFKADMERDDRKNKNMGLVFITIFLSVFIFAGGFFFYKSSQNLIKVMKVIFMGKLALLYGVFMIIPTLLSSLFGLVFIGVPTVGILQSLDYNIASLQFIFEDFRWPVIVLLLFLGVHCAIALFKIKFMDKNAIKIVWLKNDRDYMKKTFSSLGSHSSVSRSSFSSSASGSSFSGGGGSSGGGGASGSW